MSRNIKTIKCLAKHVGKTVRVVADSGESFLATVEKDDRGITLYTTDKKAKEAFYWWSAGAGKYGHHCYKSVHILDELKSLSLEIKEGFATEDDVKKNVGRFCKLSNGMIGKIVPDSASPLLLLKEDDVHIGWPLSTDSKWRKEGWEYGWHMHDQGCETAKIVEFFDKDPTVKKKRTKKAKTIVLSDELKKNVGHYCEMYDGSEGFIAKSCYNGNVCIIHNSDGPSEGWPLKGSRRNEVVGLSKKFLSKFTKGWHVGDDFQATQVKVTKILDKTYEPKETSKREESTPKKTERFLSKEQIEKGIGYFCTMADGSEGYIAHTKSGAPLVLHNAGKTCNGWRFDPEDYESTKEDKEFCKKYKRAWWINHDTNAEEVKIVKILDTQPEKKCEESSKKTILDLTVRELLEKLDEIIKC